MAMKDKYYFDKLYKEDKDLFVWKGKHHEELEDLDKYVKKGAKILDLGAGEGGDSLYLASKGFSVTAVDISETGLEKLERLARKEDLKVQTAVADLEEYRIKEDYDAIISFAAIHFLERHQIVSLIENMKAKTTPGGLNVILVFRKGDSTEGDFQMYYFDDGELKAFYEDWEILDYDEYEDMDTDHDEPHTHKIAFIKARKK